MKSLKFKRFSAYILDLMFVILIASMLMQVSFINPSFEEYYATQTEILDLINESYNTGNDIDIEQYRDLSYQLIKYGYIYNILNVLVYFGYFVIFQYYAKGQTLGKKIFKIKVINNNKKDVKFTQLLVRNLFITTILAQSLSLVLILFLSSEVFFAYDSFITSFSFILLFITGLMVLFKKDGIGLHDKIAKTNVIQI